MNTRQAQRDMDRLVRLYVGGDSVDDFLNGLSPKRLADLKQRVLGEAVPDDEIAKVASQVIRCSGEQLAEWTSYFADYDPQDGDSADLVEEAAGYLASEGHCILAYLALASWKPNTIRCMQQSLADRGCS